MKILFVIEDEMHAEQCGEYLSFELALQELQRRSKIDWNLPPNQCPCTNWQDCCRNYEIIEYDTSEKFWKELERKLILTVSKEGAVWNAVYNNSSKQ